MASLLHLLFFSFNLRCEILILRGTFVDLLTLGFDKAIDLLDETAADESISEVSCSRRLIEDRELGFNHLFLKLDKLLDISFLYSAIASSCQIIFTLLFSICGTGSQLGKCSARFRGRVNDDNIRSR